MKRILIIGANSAIAEAVAKRLAAQGSALYLAARRPEKLEILAEDLKVRGASAIHTEIFDANNLDGHKALIDRADAALNRMDAILIAHGTLSDQKACQLSTDLTLAEIKTNALSVISLLTPVSNLFEERKAGTIAVISSVAGDRGRQSNYVYGSAKAMVTAFLSGLRQRLGKSGVRVLTIKPGFIDTPMTKDFKKGPLWATPDVAAADIVRAMDRSGGDVYTPWFWRFIMLIIRNIPEFVFAKLKL
jgi:short-subunit dehydrogenase